MEKFKIPSRRGRRSAISFNPSREFLEQQVADFLNQGGRITRIETVKTNYETIAALPENSHLADDFLLDR